MGGRSLGLKRPCVMGETSLNIISAAVILNQELSRLWCHSSSINLKNLRKFSLQNWLKFPDMFHPNNVFSFVIIKEIMRLQACLDIKIWRKRKASRGCIFHCLDNQSWGWGSWEGELVSVFLYFSNISLRNNAAGSREICAYQYWTCSY